MGDKKNTILDAAITLFTADGYHSTTMSGIAGACNVSKATLYKYFPSKEELLVEAFIHAGNKFIEEGKAIDMDASLSEKEKLVKKLASNMRIFIDKMGFMNAAHHYIPLNDPLSKFKPRIIEHQSAILRHQRQMLIDAFGAEIEDIAWDATFTMMGIMHQLMMLHHYDLEATYEKSAQYLFDCIDGMLEKRAGKPRLFDASLMATHMRCKEGRKSMDSYIDDIRMSSTGMNKADREKVEAALAVLENHLHKGKAERLIADGMLAMLSEYIEIKDPVTHLRKALEMAHR